MTRPSPPKLRPLLDAATFQQLQDELDQMAVNCTGLIQGFGEYLEPMNAAVDEIRALLDAGDAVAVVAKKREFETQISPSLRRSKDLLGQISAGIGAVQLAFDAAKIASPASWPVMRRPRPG